MQGHVNLSGYGLTATPNVTPSYSVPMGQAPAVPTAEMGKGKSRSSGCQMRRMGRAGTRCRCNGKLVKTSRCRR